MLQRLMAFLRSWGRGGVKVAKTRDDNTQPLRRDDVLERERAKLELEAFEHELRLIAANVTRSKGRLSDESLR